MGEIIEATMSNQTGKPMTFEELLQLKWEIERTEVFTPQQQQILQDWNNRILKNAQFAGEKT